MGLFNRQRNDSAPHEAGDPGPAWDPASGDSLPIAGYDRLTAKEITAQLHELSQVELGAIDEHEREHKARQPVLAKLAYLRRSEPLRDYDKLDSDAIGQALAGLDAEQVKAVRDYERKFQGRRQVLDEAARLLPDAPESANEARAREEKSSRVRASMRRRPGAPPA